MWFLCLLQILPFLFLSAPITIDYMSSKAHTMWMGCALVMLMTHWQTQRTTQILWEMKKITVDNQ